MSYCPYRDKTLDCPTPIHCHHNGCHRKKQDSKAASLRQAAQEAEAQGAEVIPFSRRGLGTLRGTASVVHDGTWEFERRQLDRREEETEFPEERGFLITVHRQPSPRSARGRYLALRKLLWKAGRPVRRARRRRERRR